MSHTELTTKRVELTNDLPDPEVEPQARRRQYSAKYKLGILEEADACTEPGQIGALLRREGLYSSHLTTWRRQRREGQLTALAPHKRGRTSQNQDAQAVELAQLRQDNQHLQARLQQAELIMDVQKKLSQLLGLTANGTQESESQ
jgi:transposase-like protein